MSEQDSRFGHTKFEKICMTMGEQNPRFGRQNFCQKILDDDERTQ